MDVQEELNGVLVGLQPYLYYYYSGCTLESHGHVFLPECSYGHLTLSCDSAY